jgi:uncharacterized protein YndB with AHSA1/START domain
MATSQVVSKTIQINAPVSKVWKALTDPALMKLWMSDFDMEINTNWEVGSPVYVRGDLHGIPFQNKGTVLQFEPGKLMQYTFWSTLSEQEDIPENYSLITIRLSPADNGTILHFTQSNFIAYTTYKHSDFYWDGTLHILKKFVEN